MQKSIFVYVCVGSYEYTVELYFFHFLGPACMYLRLYSISPFGIFMHSFGLIVSFVSLVLIININCYCLVMIDNRQLCK